MMGSHHSNLASRYGLDFMFWSSKNPRMEPSTNPRTVANPRMVTNPMIVNPIFPPKW